jgi:hypothetical protein
MAIFKKETHFVRGKCSWFRLRQTNKWDKWSVTLHPVKDDLDKIRDWQAEGVKNVIKKDDDGYFVTFTRPVKKETKTGKVLVFRPPYVNLVTDGNKEPYDGNVGNGSDIELELEVYEHPTPNGGKAKAVRLVGANIHTLVPFDGNNDFTKDEYEVVSKAVDQPEPLWH